MSLLLAASALLLTGCTQRPAPHDEDSTADIELYVQQHLDSEWQRLSGGTQRPPSAATLFFVPYGWDHVIESCMSTAGFSTDAAGAATVDGADPALHGAAGLAWYLCLQHYPTYTVHFTELRAPQLDLLYAYYATRLVPCLELNGGDPGAAPSIADFIAGGPGRPGGWNPYLSSSRPDSLAAATILFDRCPPYPARLVQP